MLQVTYSDNWNFQKNIQLPFQTPTIIPVMGIQSEWMSLADFNSMTVKAPAVLVKPQLCR